MDPTIEPTIKQDLAWQALQDKTIKYVGFGGGSGGGKAQSLDSKIFTPDGYKLMRDIQIGDYVLGNDGKTKVVAIHPQGIQRIYRVKFIDGAVSEFTEEHLFDCWKTRRGRKSRKIRTLKEITKLKSNVSISFGVAHFNKRKVNIDPYILGIMLGDGGLTKHLTLTSEDKEIVNEVQKRLPNKLKIRQKKEIQYSIVQDERNNKGYPINILAQEFGKYGLLPIKCEDRFIPEDYLYNSIEIRLEVLRGLFDTDGYIDERGHIDFVSKSKKLAENVQFLVRSLGGKATLTKVKKRFKNFIGDYYRLYIVLQKYCPLKLKRKKKRLKSRKEIGRRIKSIQFIGKKEAKCITVSNDNGLYLTDDFILTHNSWLGAEWLMTSCYMYPGTRWFIGRNELSRLMKSSYITFEKVCLHHKIPQNDWHLNGQYNFISFKNGSRIDLLDLKYQPSDPMYERFGSLEYTGGWVDEAGEIDFTAFDVLKSRIGRHRNEDYGLFPAKMLITFNPKKNWLYQLFYKPKRDGTLPPEYEFIQALYGDNPHTAKTYGEELKQIKDKATKQRLMYGNWDYEDSVRALFKYDALVDVFSNTVIKTGNKYLLVDIADDGSDKTIFSFWEDLEEYRRETYDHLNTETIINHIREFASQDQIPYSHIAVDAIGVGAGVASSSMLDGIVGFKSSYSAIKTDQDIVYLPNVSYLKTAKLVSDYKNLRSQCVFTLADLVNKHLVASKMEGIEKDRIIEELSVYQDITKEGSKRMATMKEEVKELLARSPDASDTWIMRMYFLIKGKMTSVDTPEGDSVAERQKEILEQNEANLAKETNK